MRKALVAGIFAAILSAGTASGIDGLSSDPLMLPQAGCESCGRQSAMTQQAMTQQAMQPPWHRNVRPPVCGPRGCGPAMPCGHGFQGHHAMPAGPACGPDCEPHGYVLPPCFPRLHAFFCEGYLLSPTPPRMPRCPQCGCHIPDGF